MSNHILNAALSYAEQGFSVIPIYGIENGVCKCSKREKCSHPGKHPKTSHGLKDATRDKDKIQQLFGRNDCNIGIATGKESGVFVVDVDAKSDGLVSMMKLDLPPTLTVKTGGGGYHFYYAYPEGKQVRNSVSKIASGIDIRGDGGYVIAPPSMHISGNSYEWSSI